MMFVDAKEFENIINLSPEGIYLSDKEGNVLFANNTFYQITEFDKNEPINIYNIISEEFTEAAKQTNNFLFENPGAIRNLTVSYKTKKGKIKWIDSITRVQSVNNNILRVAFIRDVTNQHKQQEELLMLNKRLKEYAFLTSHKLRHPIANIIGLVDLFNYSNINAAENLIILESLSKSANILNQVVFELHQSLSNQTNYLNNNVEQGPAKKINQIMLIDDDLINNYINKTNILRIDKSIEVIELQNAKIALEWLQSKKANPELILLDLTMPLMNGWEFLEIFKTLNLFNTKICILTTSINSDDIARSHSYEIEIDFISKPLTNDKIAKLLHH
ncbi:MAG: response regulator [Bacteroidia bacterium]